ncbi:MAG TPA: CDP-glucose 4,6-dehydratase [Negativicutes bacterium]|nr:CDP-glucose 4,6-dehydratase [Negativicutes bacterium]
MDGLVTMPDWLSAYNGKSVFVTGDTGFKGSWLVRWLLLAGAKVSGYALPPERAVNHFVRLGLAHKMHHVDGDIRDIDSLLMAVRQAQPEFFFHLAAQPIVRTSYEQPKETFDTNVGGSVNVLEVVRQTESIRSLIYVTSDKCYRNKEWIWGYRENDELGGKDPYSASKAAAEIVFQAYRESFFDNRSELGVASVRAGNVIGGGDWAADRIVPDCVRALQDGLPIILRNPGATRPWQYVLEPLSGYLLLGAKMYKSPKQFSGSWNFGPGGGAGHTVGELAKILHDGWGGADSPLQLMAGGPHEAGLLSLNCDKAATELGWRPRWNFATTVGQTLRWYKDVHEGTAEETVTIQQIREYMEAGHD